MFEMWEDPGGIQQMGLAQEVTHLREKLGQQPDDDDDYYNHSFSGSGLQWDLWGIREMNESSVVCCWSDNWWLGNSISSLTRIC